MSAEATSEIPPPPTGDALFVEVTAELRERPGVDTGPMLHTTALRIDEKAFAFVGQGDRLIVKLPAERCRDLVAAHDATPLRMGARVMREWVAVPLGDDATRLWGQLVRESAAYVETVPVSPRRRRPRAAAI